MRTPVILLVLSILATCSFAGVGCLSDPIVSPTSEITPIEAPTRVTVLKGARPGVTSGGGFVDIEGLSEPIVSPAVGVTRVDAPTATSITVLEIQGTQPGVTSAVVWIVEESP